jgi:hypothetical protein
MEMEMIRTQPPANNVDQQIEDFRKRKVSEFDRNGESKRQHCLDLR